MDLAGLVACSAPSHSHGGAVVGGGAGDAGRRRVGGGSPGLRRAAGGADQLRPAQALAQALRLDLPAR